jgi:two-component system response regulator HydG
MLKVLVVDDDAGLRISLGSSLHQTGRFQVEEAIDGVDAIEKVTAANSNYNVIVLDVDMPRMNGLEALKKLKEHDPSLVILILTAHATIEDAVRAVKEGAYDYVSKPVQTAALIEMIDRAMHAHQMISNLIFSAPTLMDGSSRFIGKTVEMQKVFHLIHRLSKVDTPVMIRGASGTGKELVARAIHMNSGRKNEKFVAINCSAIPENLFESELFGHEKGAFTSADARKIGKLQYAEGGTLFLDELGDLPVLMQVKLLRVLQERKFTPVGANREQDMNVRIIAATNRPLEKMIQEQSFREDLFYRLNVIPIYLPELKDRKNDIDLLTNHFLTKFNQQHNRKVTGLSPEAMAILKKYDWPGNIRELENVIEHCFIMETGHRINIQAIPEKLLTSLGIRNNTVTVESIDGGEDTVTTSNVGILITDEKLDFNRHKEMFEKEFIIKALKTFGGRINQTALHANIPKKTLLRKIEKYAINPRDYK